MKRLLPLLIAAGVLLAMGAAWATTGQADDPPASVTLDTTKVASAAPVSGDTETARAGRAGTVTYTRTGDSLAVDSVSPADGWGYVIEVATGREIEVTFRNAGARVDFQAELEDGRVEIRVRTRTTTAATTTTEPDRTTTSGAPTSTSGTSVTSTSFDDDAVTGTSFDDDGGERGDDVSDDGPGDDHGGDRDDDASDDGPGDDHGGDDHGGDDHGGDDD